MRLHTCAALPALVLLGCGPQGSSQSMGMAANGGGSGASSAATGGSAASAGGTGGSARAGSAAAGSTVNAGFAGTPTAVPAAGTGGSAAGGSGGAAVPTGGNGGQPDAGSKPSIPATNACPDGAFCDSFDDSSASTLDPARWSTVTPNCTGTGQVALDDAVFHSGKRALRVQGGAGYCNHVFASPVGFQPPDPFYARMFVRFAAPLGASHVTFVAMHDGNEDKDLRMGGQSEILMWNRESDDATLPELSPAGIALSEKPEAAAWMCVELMIDAHARTLRTWVDGEAVAGLTVEGEPTQDIDGQWQNKPDWQPKLQDVKVGWESYGDAANTLWFDDVAFGSTRFGCDR